MPVPTVAISQLVALDCLCGAHLEGEDTDDLTIVYREHLLTLHPDVQMDRVTLEAFVVANAYEI
jgi:UDP-N-acetylglucosamine enolpyruvyl transferase